MYVISERWTFRNDFNFSNTTKIQTGSNMKRSVT